MAETVWRSEDVAPDDAAWVMSPEGRAVLDELLARGPDADPLATASWLRDRGLSGARAATAQGVAAAMPSLRGVAQAHREQSADLALAAARAIGGAALERFPQAPLRAALEMLAQEIDASPRLVVRAAGLDDQARSQIEQACADSGFTGVV